MLLKSTSKIERSSLLITASSKFWPNAREMIKLIFLLDGERSSRKNFSMTLHIITI